MVGAKSLKSLRWALGASGILGLLSAASAFLCTQSAYGHSVVAMHIASDLPPWAIEAAAPPGAIVMLILGSLCALLLVCGSWPIRVCAALAVAWFVYANSAFGPGSYWSAQMGENFDLTPFHVGGVVGVVVLLAVSVLALVLAARPMVMARSFAGSPLRPGMTGS